MAGKGSRFFEAGYKEPKPFIPIHGKPMIQVVVDNLKPKIPHRFIFICQNVHIKEYDLKAKLPEYAGNETVVIGIDGITEGQICTVLKAQDLIDNDLPVMTANSDQYIDFDINDYLHSMTTRQLDGLIMTMSSNDPKWSYARCEGDYVVETAEKKVISHDATVGIFNFKRGKDLVKAAHAMMKDNIRVNGEFYTCPAYNYLIDEGKKIGIYPIGEEYNGMYGLGIPKDLEFFLKHPISERI